MILLYITTPCPHVSAHADRYQGMLTPLSKLSATLLGAASVALIACLRAIIHPWVGNFPVLVIFAPCMVLAARRGGVVPGLVTTLLSALCGAFLLADPNAPESWSLAQSINLVLLALTGV